MKNLPTLFLRCFLLMFPLLLQAESFDDLMKKADAASSLEERLAFCGKALEAGRGRNRFEAAKKGFETAIRMNDPEQIYRFGVILSQLPEGTDAERAEARFKALVSTAPYTYKNSISGQFIVPLSAWEDFLRMPGRTAEQDFEALFRMGADSLARANWPAAEQALARAVRIEGMPGNRMIQAHLMHAEALRSVGRRDEALQTCRRIINAKNIPPYVQARALDLCARTLISGSTEYYFEIPPQDLKEAWSCWEKIRKIKPLNIRIYSEYMRNYTAAAFSGKDYARTVTAADTILADRKQPVDSYTWSLISLYKGRALLELKRPSEAVPVFEKLRDMNFMPGDTMRYLGQAYYMNREYTLAIGAVQQAMEELKRRQAGATPIVWCEQQMKKLAWFRENSAKLDEIMRNYEKRTGRSSGEKGNSKSMIPETRKKKKTVRNIEDIDADSGGAITESGLQIE